jgi:hypothetical protein
MKKIFFILILSFFSTSGYSGVSYPSSDGADGSKKAGAEPPKSYRTCPDGNEPTKGISDDGYYFTYTCGSVAEVPVVTPKAEVASETTSDLGEVDYIAKIKEAMTLLDSGIISEEEFEKMKKKIIDNM